MESIDPQRDEILLARNDRYWGEAANPDQVLFRRGGAPAALADSIRNGDTQVAQVHGGAAAFAQLSAIPDVRTARIVTPRVMQLTLRAQQPALADDQVRQAILGLLDVDLLAAVGAGGRKHGHAGAGAGAITVGPRLRPDGATRDDPRGGAWDCWPTPDTQIESVPTTTSATAHPEPAGEQPGAASARTASR